MGAHSTILSTFNCSGFGQVAIALDFDTLQAYVLLVRMRCVGGCHWLECDVWEAAIG